MNIIIHPELQAITDPLSQQEYLALEQSLLKEGCRDALVLWGETLIDGHNRYQLCQKHAIVFETRQCADFKNIDDVILWSIDNQLARRSISGFQRGVLALRKKEIITTRRKEKSPKERKEEQETLKQAPDPISVETREEIAKMAGVSKPAVAQIEKICKAASPELVQAVRAGTISINTAAAIASLPLEQQVNAVAGGKKELQTTARQMRQTRPTKVKNAQISEEDNNEMSANPPAFTDASEEVRYLRQKILSMETENQDLKGKIVALKATLQQMQSSENPDVSSANG